MHIMKKIIIDTLGADNGALPIVRGVLNAMNKNDGFSVVFVGDRAFIESVSDDFEELKSRIEFIHTESFVPDDALPTCVFKGCDDTSMVKSLVRLKEDDECVAMVSAGNTGALLVGTIFRLGLAKGLMSPALATALPCKKEGLVALLDCGANTECTPDDLKRYALMGNAYMKCLMGIENPRVALMSVGKTPHKGNALVKDAYPLIEALGLNFIGNIEGSDLVDSPADVIVTDGFTGNILLKNTESAGTFAIETARQILSESEQCQKLTEALYSKFAFNDLGGATFLGAKKTVVKMHGAANENTAKECVLQALNLEKRNLSQKIEECLN